MSKTEVITIYSVDTKELRAQMVRKGLTMNELADKIGVSRATVSLVMRGKSPSYPFMAAAMEALDLDREMATKIFFATGLRNA